MVVLYIVQFKLLSVTNIIKIVTLIEKVFLKKILKKC